MFKMKTIHLTHHKERIINCIRIALVKNSIMSVTTTGNLKKPRLGFVTNGEPTTKAPRKCLNVN